jgi:hypothetical protein
VTAVPRLGGSTIAVAATREAVWVLTCARACSGGRVSSGQLVELASRSGRVIKRFPVADPQALALGYGALWIAHFRTGAVTRVDPANGRTTASLQLTLPRPIVVVGNGESGRRGHDAAPCSPVACSDPRVYRLYAFLPSSIRTGGGEVWVSTARGWIAEIDPRTSKLVAMVPSPSEDNATVAESHGTWVAEDLDGVGFIEHGSRRLTLHAISEAGQSVAVSQLVSGGGLIWAYGTFLNPAYPAHGELNSSVVTAIDPRTGEIVHQQQFAYAADAIVYGAGGLYVADFGNGLLFRIGADFRVQTLRSLRGPENLVAATPGALWATTASGRLLRLALPIPP